MSPMLNANLGRLDNFEERTLAAHNRERAALGIGPMQWDERLARDAQAYADQLTRIGYLIHSPDDESDPQGENLWAGTRGYYNAENMVGLWVAEKKYFKQGVFPNNSTTGSFEDVGHYTQLTWRNSARVGCAVAQGRGDDFMVCRYSEAGNVMGERPF
jgi:uncharacterized protein YkwD